MTKATQKQRRAVSADWAMINPVLDPGEFAFETDTRIFKIGNGVQHWSEIDLPYIPANIMTKKGDLVVMGPSMVQGLENPNFSVDVNNNGIADGWSVVGNPALVSIVSGSQQVRSVGGQTTAVAQAVVVVAGQTYKLSGKYVFNFLGGGPDQLVFTMTYYSDVDSTIVLDTETLTITSGTPNEPSDWFILSTAPVSAIRARISLAATNGANVKFTSVSLVNTTSHGYSRLEAGSPGQVLGQDDDGFLIWSDEDSGSGFAYVTKTKMLTDFKKISDAATDHASMELASHAAATFETQNNAEIAHALHQYSVNAVRDYHTPTTIVGLFENKDVTVVKSADQTVINSTTQVNDSALSFSMVANGIYIFEMMLLVSGTTANGLRIELHASTCLSNIWGVHCEIPAGGATSGIMDFAVSTGTDVSPGFQLIGLDGSTALFATVRGTIFNGASAGTAQLTFAQSTAASSTSCTIKKDSTLRAIRAS